MWQTSEIDYIVRFNIFQPKLPFQSKNVSPNKKAITKEFGFDRNDSQHNGYRPLIFQGQNKATMSQPE